LRRDPLFAQSAQKMYKDVDISKQLSQLLARLQRHASNSHEMVVKRHRDPGEMSSLIGSKTTLVNHVGGIGIVVLMQPYTKSYH